jgi:hypothetical protein
MRVLYALERQSAVASSDGLLAEALPELVKNLLLVASSLGFFPLLRPSPSEHTPEVGSSTTAGTHESASESPSLASGLPVDDDRWLHTWDLACRIAPALAQDQHLSTLLKQNRANANYGERE